MPDSVTGRPLLLGVLRIKELSILLVTIAAAGYFTATSDAFNSAENYQTIAQYVAPWAIIAAGQVMLLICGEIDLSAGFVFTLAPFTLTLFSVNGAPLWLALLGSVLLSTLIGVVNGLIRTVLNIPSFITTLGMAFLLQGLVLIISDARPVSAPSGNWLVEVFGGAAWSEFAWAVVIVALMQVVLSATGSASTPRPPAATRWAPRSPVSRSTASRSSTSRSSARWPGSRASCRAPGSAPTTRPTAASR